MAMNQRPAPHSIRSAWRPSRRDLLRAAGLSGLGIGLFGRGLPELRAATAPKRFVQINLEGGWDSSLATDPIIGAKTTVDTYEMILRQPSDDLRPVTVSGKDKLVLGPGLAPAAPAFAMMPTTFINGLTMDVTAHDFAAQYMSSGRLSLSNSRDYPCIPAVLSASLGQFPPHVAIGTLPPLGETRFSTPPLHALDPRAIAEMVAGPSGSRARPSLVADSHALLDALDAHAYGQLSAAQQTSLKVWRESSQRVDGLYAKQLLGKLTPDESMLARYGADLYPGDITSGPESRLAHLMLLMTSNLAPYLTMTFGSFDTHENQMAVHLPLMRRFAAALNTFVADLVATDDPAAPGYKLADTTTLYITSEFVRSPRFSSVGGTEHWQSASAIVMGKDVRDNQVIGATHTDAMPLGWDGRRPAILTHDNRLLPNHVVATILARFGATPAADDVGEGRLDALFI